MKTRGPIAEYLERAKQLSSEETERLLARLRGRFRRRTEDRRLSTLEALALQLEYEDEELAEWRERMSELRAQEEKLNEGAVAASLMTGQHH